MTDTHGNPLNYTGYPTGIRAVGANFSGSVTVGTWGVPLSYLSLSGSGDTLTISAEDEYGNGYSGNITMSCSSSTSCDSNHQCSAPATCAQIPAPSCSIGFASSSVNAGNSATVNWTTFNTTSSSLTCSGSTSYSQSPVAGNSASINFNSAGTAKQETCTLDVTGPGGNSSCTTQQVLTVNPMHGACGTSASDTPSCVAFDSGNLCNTSWGNSNPTYDSSTGVTSWICKGSDSGYSTNCSYTQLPSLNGSCGPANGTPTATKPSGNQLCAFGSTSSPVSGSGPWSWSCGGSCSGTAASCSTTPDTDWKEVSPN